MTQQIEQILNITMRAQLKPVTAIFRLLIFDGQKMPKLSCKIWAPAGWDKILLTPLHGYRSKFKTLRPQTHIKLGSENPKSHTHTATWGSTSICAHGFNFSVFSRWLYFKLRHGAPSFGVWSALEVLSWLVGLEAWALCKTLCQHFILVQR